VWKVRTEGWSMTPRRLYGLGLVFVVVDYDHPQLWAIKPDGHGDVTDTHVVWKITKGMPSRPSFLLIDDLLYLVTSDGIVLADPLNPEFAAWLKGELARIPGIGDKTSTKLLREFGSYERVKGASEDDLAAHIGRAAARKLRAALETAN